MENVVERGGPGRSVKRSSLPRVMQKRQAADILIIITLLQQLLNDMLRSGSAFFLVASEIFKVGKSPCHSFLLTGKR